MKGLESKNWDRSRLQIFFFGRIGLSVVYLVFDIIIIIRIKIRRVFFDYH